MINFKIEKHIKDKIIRFKNFIAFVAHHFVLDDCPYRASALAFTTLLAIVPLMSVSLAILAIFPVFNEWREPIQTFIFSNFVPATGQVLEEYLHLFTAQVSKLSLVGLLFLIVSALLVMYTIERSLNHIWRVESSRKGVTAFLLYWAILSLGPIFLGLSLALSSYLFSMPLFYEEQIFSLVFLLPSILSLAGFTFLYVVVPNCKVKLHHGFIGALIATLLFEGAKKCFVFYLGSYSSYELLYGAFAIIPIFFVWIYWVWLITLFGAEISYALAVSYKRRQGFALDPFTNVLIWLKHLWINQTKGESVSFDELINLSHKPFSIDVRELVAKLLEIRLIKITFDGNFMLSRDLDHLTLYELRKLLPYRFPPLEEIANPSNEFEKNWYEIVAKIDQSLKKYASLSLVDLFNKHI